MQLELLFAGHHLGLQLDKGLLHLDVMNGEGGGVDGEG